MQNYIEPSFHDWDLLIKRPTDSYNDLESIVSRVFKSVKKEGDHAKKIDAILYGMETIGSEERSCNVDEMRELFHSISHGMFSRLLFNLFGKERVLKELNEFLSLDFIPRCGGGIGVTRLMRAMELSKQEKPYKALHIPALKMLEKTL